MPWLPNDHMADVHIIRQDYARALSDFATYPTAANEEALDEQAQRRARAIRMVHHEDGASVRHLAAMFRCPKGVIRTAIEEGWD